MTAPERDQGLSEVRYTLAEARQELLRQDCRRYGHTWKILSTLTGPDHLICQCGESVSVMTAVRVRVARAEALREAAAELPGYDYIEDAVAWLRERAYRIGQAP